jgi:hypothetical protein
MIVKYIYIFFLIICSAQCFAQRIIFKGNLKADNEIPVAYANIVFLNSNKGTITDLKGNFSIKAHHKDTLQISHVAYETIIIVLDSSEQQLLITMNEKSFVFNEIAVNATKSIKLQGRTERIGYNKYKGKSSFHLTSGCLLATYIKNEQRAEGVIKKIKIRIKDKGNYKTEKIRVRLLSNNKYITQPGEDILQEQLIFPIHKINKKLTIDISEYNLIFPKEGIFIVVEWLYSNDENKVKNDSFSVAATLKNKQNIVWFSYMDKKWSQRRTSIISNERRYMTPKVGLEVLF